MFKLSDGPSLVYVNVFVRSFSKIDDVKMVRALIIFNAIYIWNTSEGPKISCNIKILHSSGVQFPSDPTSAME